MKLNLMTIAILVPVTFCSQAASDASFFSSDKFSADISLGVLSGKTQERVYDPDEGGRKISQLDWKYNNAPIIKGSMSWDVIDRMSLGLSGWTTFASRSGNMVDTDWTDTSSPNVWTDKSVHPNTRLNYANEFDFNLTGWILKEPEYRLGLMAGYKESRNSFEASGGSYIYSDEELYDTVGTFPSGERGIGYKQRYKVPYVGLTGVWRYEKFDVGGAFKYSGWVKAYDNDEHYAREITYRSHVRNQNFYSISASMGYYVTPNARVYLEGTWNRITNKKGYTWLHDRTDNTFESGKDLAGIESYNFVTTAGLKYTF